MEENSNNFAPQIKNENYLENKIEVVIPVLELYESVEDDLKKIGIRIRLDLYDGMDSCIRVNKNALKLCLINTLYYFIEKCEGLSTLSGNFSSFKKIFLVLKYALTTSISKL